MKNNEVELARTIVELAKQINIKGANQTHYVMVRDSTERDLAEEITDLELIDKALIISPE